MSANVPAAYGVQFNEYGGADDVPMNAPFE
jgi:hypothetical protein